jgi:hypothetical protein
MNKFSVQKRIKRKTQFFSARKSVSVFNTAAYGKNVLLFFLNSIFLGSLGPFDSQISFFQNHSYFSKEDIRLEVITDILRISVILGPNFAYFPKCFALVSNTLACSPF